MPELNYRISVFGSGNRSSDRTLGKGDGIESITFTLGPSGGSVEAVVTGLASALSVVAFSVVQIKLGYGSNFQNEVNFRGYAVQASDEDAAGLGTLKLAGLKDLMRRLPVTANVFPEGDVGEIARRAVSAVLSRFKETTFGYSSASIPDTGAVLGEVIPKYESLKEFLDTLSGAAAVTWWVDGLGFVHFKANTESQTIIERSAQPEVSVLRPDVSFEDYCDEVILYINDEVQGAEFQGGTPRRDFILTPHVVHGRRGGLGPSTRAVAPKVVPLPEFYPYKRFPVSASSFSGNGFANPYNIFDQDKTTYMHNTSTDFSYRVSGYEGDFLHGLELDYSLSGNSDTRVDVGLIYEFRRPGSAPRTALVTRKLEPGQGIIAIAVPEIVALAEGYVFHHCDITLRVPNGYSVAANAFRVYELKPLNEATELRALALSYLVDDSEAAPDVFAQDQLLRPTPFVRLNDSAGSNTYKAAAYDYEVSADGGHRSVARLEQASEPEREAQLALERQRQSALEVRARRSR